MVVAECGGVVGGVSDFQVSHNLVRTASGLNGTRPVVQKAKQTVDALKVCYRIE